MKNRSLLFALASHCIKIGRAFGIDIRIHWTFWILPAAFAIMYAPLGLRGDAVMIGLVFAIYACVVLHEYGHALTARVFGVRTRDIILTPIGGIARLETMPEDPLQEIIIALAGPAVSIAIFFALLLLLVFGFPGVFERVAPMTVDRGITSLPEFLLCVCFSNLILVLLNMLPAFPSDGGRVFRAVMQLFVSRVRATEVAVYLGAVVALCLAVVGILQGVPTLPLVAMLFAFVGQMELWMVRQQSQTRARLWAESQNVMLEEAVSLPPPEPNFTGYAWNPHEATWVEWQGGRAVRRCRTHGW